MTTRQNQLINRIQFLMQKQHLDIKELSQNSGISLGELNQYLNKHEPITSTKKLSQLAMAFHITLPQLLLGSPQNPNLTQDEKQLLVLFRQLDSDKKEILHAFLKGCQYSFI